MNRELAMKIFGFAALIAVSVCFGQAPTITWKIHDRERPLPPVVDPGTPSTQDAPGKPPSDAIVLFDGKDLSQWETGKKEPAKWKVENGYFEVVEKSGAIQSQARFR